MAVTIRMTRQGTTKKPFYRIVVADKESPRDGKFLEIVGHYNPVAKPPKVDLKGERIAHWLGIGAIPSATVKQLIKKAGLGTTGKVEAA